MHFKSALDCGAYGSYGVASTFYTGALQTVTYDIPAYRFEGCRLFTNKPPCGPKRGHGTPQPRFAIELHLEKIAHDLGIDAVEMKRRNFVKPMTRTVNWLRVTSCGLEECTDRVIEASGYLERVKRAGHGMGFAISSYLSGAGTAIYWNDMPHSEVQIKVDRGGVTAYCGAMDIGQGSDSVLAAIVAEELGLQPRDIRLVTADTDSTPIDLGSYSSRVTFMAGNAALEAARKMRAMLVEAVEAGGRKFEEVSFEEASVLAEARYGAKEAGQGPLLPVIPAVNAAVFDALGVWIDETPVTPEKVVEALRRQGKGEPGRFGPARFPDIPYPECIKVEPPPRELGS